MQYRFIIGVVVLLIAFLTEGCTTDSSEPCPEPDPCPKLDCQEGDLSGCPEVECPDCEACEDCNEFMIENIPAVESWVNSPHNDEESDAFRNWDENDPPAIPGSCASCHSTIGYIDYVGGDGSEQFSMELESVDIGETIECNACHAPGAGKMDAIPFPSGAIISGLGSESRCMICHQGQASKVQVDEAIEANGLTNDMDTPKDELGFVNIHYYAAAATLFGTAASGGYEYEGKSYDFKNDHVEGYDTCVSCHKSHSLELKIDECASCHAGVASVEDIRMIRMEGSEKDYNGNGDGKEGIADEIAGLRDMLYQGIQAYANEVVGIPLVYDAHTYPYFFIDTNADGEADKDEANYGNKYNAWTARLLKAAFNYQTASQDPGAYVHGGKYIIQLLYDSIENLNEVIESKVDLTSAHRIDAGHFAGSENAFRHWDESGSVSGNCARCHSANGLPRYLNEGVNISESVSNGINCATCHDDLTSYTRFVIDSATFPSGRMVSFGEGDDSNLCLQCHQGQQSTTQIDEHIANSGAVDDEVSDKLGFQNPHYFAAGATLFGTEVKGAYEFDDESYNSRYFHVPQFDTCIDCHSTHGLDVMAESCGTCHTGVENLEEIRMSNVDYDGDGDIAEGIAGEINTMSELLYEAILAYAGDNPEAAAIVYDRNTYPYWFIDLNGNAEPDPDETHYGNLYMSWTPRMLRSVYNYTWVQNDPGSYVHNAYYMLQVLYDSLMDIGADVSSMTRPEP